MTDLIERLHKQAAEIAAAGHNGWGNTMTEAADALEAAREDAERYRWLVNSGAYSPGHGSKSCPWGLAMSGPKSSKAALDAAIDAARKEVGGE